MTTKFQGVSNSRMNTEENVRQPQKPKSDTFPKWNGQCLQGSKIVLEFWHKGCERIRTTNYSTCIYTINISPFLCIRNSHRIFRKGSFFITNPNDKLLSGRNYAGYAIYLGNDFKWHPLLDPLMFHLRPESLNQLWPFYIKYQLIVQSQFIL